MTGLPLSALADVVRSKNAGPTQLTVDIFFKDSAAYNLAQHSPRLSCAAVAERYQLPAEQVQRYLLPTDHVLNSDGITVHEPLRVRRVAWTDVQGVIWKHEQGFLRVSREVSGRAVARTDGMRGFTILLGSDPVAAESRRQAVDAFLRRHG